MRRTMLLLPILVYASMAVLAGGQGEGTDDDTVRIGVAYQNLQNEFIINIQDGMRAKAEELGVELLEADGRGQAESQISQVELFLTQAVDAIVLNPFDRDGSAPAVDLAVEAGIPIVVVNALVSNIDRATAYVGSNDVVAGRIEAQYIADLLEGQGNVVIIHGPFGHSAEIQRTEGNREVLDQYPGIEIVAEQTANWDRAEALELTENWLTSGMEIDAIIAQNDEMALGAFVAVEAAGLADEVFVIGIDAIPDALQSVGRGELAATVFQDARGQAAGALELAYRAAMGEEVPTLLDIPFILVTQENLADFM